MVRLDSDRYAEITERLVKLRDLTAGLAEAYDDPVAKQGAGQMQASLERVLQLLRHRK